MAEDGKADEMLQWVELAEKEQQECFHFFGSPMWREFEPSQYVLLRKQIGYLFFGVPEEVPCANSSDSTGYRDEKLKGINNIFDIIKKCTINNPNPNIISVAFLFVFRKTGNDFITIPVIRILQFDMTFRQNINLFIDKYGRVYKNWQDYLDNNKIPDCVLCYPRNGVYSAVNGAVEVEFGISPAGRTGAKLLKGLDIGGTVLSVGATAAKVFLPVSVPVVVG
jgi:hypothetical protein